MSRVMLFSLSIALFISIALGYIAGIFLRLFWVVWWYDLVLHGLGGFAVGILAGSLFVTSRDKILLVLFKIMVPVALAAVTWEFVDTADIQIVRDYVVDTATDLTLGIAGGLVAVVVVGLSARAK